MVVDITYRPYSRTDNEACLRLFDANCPKYFASNERVDYADFLGSDPEGYELCIVNGQVTGAFGLIGNSASRGRLNWIMLSPLSQGLGIGSAIMDRIIAQATDSKLQVLDIAASHKSAPFFARFGAVTKKVIRNGWGPNMHRSDMELTVKKAQ